MRQAVTIIRQVEEAATADVQPHIQFLQSRQLKLIALSPHDSSPEALTAFRLVFPEAYQDLMVGNLIQFPVHSDSENSSDGG